MARAINKRLKDYIKANVGHEVESNLLKSPMNNRRHKFLTLDNGLRVLLVSDPNVHEDIADNKTLREGTPPKRRRRDEANDSTSSESGESQQAETDSSEEPNQNGSTDVNANEENNDDSEAYADNDKEAAAALCVDVGSFENPDHLPGIAHLLEHVILMGNKKYPKLNEFDIFLTKRSGSSNATTYHSRTLYEVEIPKKHLQECLDRFAHTFISPLLLKESIEKEIEPVDSEYLEGLSNDDSRIEQFFTVFAKDGHPCGTFSWGNRKSLWQSPAEKGIDIRNELHNFWTQHYVAEKMVLCVQSQENFDTLEKWVQVFSEIPSAKKHGRKLPPPRVPAHPPFKEDFHSLCYVKPVLDFHRLLFSWSLPSQLNHYQTKPMTHLGSLIGHEGKGGLLSVLRRKGLITSLCAGNDETDSDHNLHHALFSIDLSLTQKGLENIDEVVQNVFSFINFLQDKGPQAYYFEEEAQIELIKLRWEDDTGALSSVTSLARNMFLYDNVHILVGPTLLFEYNKKLIDDCLQMLVPEACNFIISTKNIADDKYEQKEKWFSIPYTLKPVPKWWLQDVPKKDRPRFVLPTKNNFIPTDFDLIEEPSTEYPVAVEMNEYYRLWFKKDSNFKIPKGHINFVLLQTYHRTSPKVAAALDLFIEILAVNISEDVYSADLAGLSYSLFMSEIGLVMTTEGFNDTLPKLVHLMVDYIVNFEFDADTFDAMKEHLAQNYFNCFTDSEKLSKSIRYAIFEPVYWTSIDKRNALKSVTVEYLLQVHKEFFSHGFMECLIQGNFAKAEAKKIADEIQKKLAYNELKKRPQPQVHELPSPTQSYCRVQCFCTTEKNSFISNYYQIGPCDIKEFVRLDLLANCMSEPAFDELRTKQGLGYSVMATFHDTFGVGGYSITVNSPADKFTCSEVDEKIEAFLIKLAQTIADMDKDEFSALVESRIITKSGPDLHLKEETDRNWNEIIGFNYCFDRLKREVKILQQITLDEFKRWSIDKLRNNCRKKLSIEVVGNGKKALEETETDFSEAKSGQAEYSLKYYVPRKAGSGKRFVKDINAFKEKLNLYPHITCDQ